MNTNNSEHQLRYSSGGSRHTYETREIRAGHATLRSAPAIVKLKLAAAQGEPTTVKARHTNVNPRLSVM